eukprot:1374288-Amphidinium_carterae.1
MSSSTSSSGHHPRQAIRAHGHGGPGGRCRLDVVSAPHQRLPPRKAEHDECDVSSIAWICIFACSKTSHVCRSE